MSVINEEIVTGMKFRTMLDKLNKKWQLLSFWTKSSDVEFEDGENAETKLGAIKGITADINTTVEGYAADMTVVRQLNSNIDSLGKSVADGKALIASAIRSKGVACESDISFADMAANIEAITTTTTNIVKIASESDYSTWTGDKTISKTFNSGNYTWICVQSFSKQSDGYILSTDITSVLEVIGDARDSMSRLCFCRVNKNTNITATLTFRANKNDPRHLQINIYGIS